MEKLVSVIVPSYNNAEFLSETLDSVLAQTYINWECIIVDDGSTDNSKEIVQQYLNKDTRFHYYYQDNQGVSEARNYGISVSSGEFILPLDSDDIIGEEYLELAMEHYSKHPDCKVVCCKAMLFGKQNGVIPFPDYSYEALKFQTPFVCASIYKRSDFDKTNGYNTNMVKGYEDWDFWLSLLSPDDIVYCIPRVLFYYRKRTESRSEIAAGDFKALIRQVQQNHISAYQDIIDNALYYALENNRLSQMYNEITNSRSYRLSKKLSALFTRFICFDKR